MSGGGGRQSSAHRVLPLKVDRPAAMACPLELVFASGALYCITVAICCRTTQVQQASYASPDTDENVR